jgi:hypothetical protein
LPKQWRWSDAEVNLTDGDAFSILVNGAVRPLPLELLDGGDHFDDMVRNQRKRRQREDAVAGLPRTGLHAFWSIMWPRKRFFMGMRQITSAFRFPHTQLSHAQNKVLTVQG